MSPRPDSLTISPTFGGLSGGRRASLCIAPTKNLDKVITHSLTIGSLSLVERDDIVNVIRVTKNSPQLHGYLGRQSNKVFCKVADLVLSQVFLEYLRSLKLLDHGSVVIDTPLVALGEIAFIKNILDGNLPFVLLNEVAERYSSLKAKERSREIKEHVTISIFTEDTNGVGSITVARP